MEIEQYLYDLNDSGEAIVAYTMSSASGGSVQVCNLGASVLSYSLPDAEGNLVDVAAGRAVRGMRTFGLDADGGVKFDERLWESRVETNRVVMSLSYESDGVGMMCEVIFDYDDDNVLEITYLACADQQTLFDLTHRLEFNLGGEIEASIKSTSSKDGIYSIDGAQRGILNEVATFASASRKITLLTSQPTLYFDPETATIMPLSSPMASLNADERYVQKSVFQPE